MLVLAQKGKSFGTIEAFLSAISFVFKFYLVRDFVQDPMIKDMKRFLAKVCRHGNNKKEAFGSTQVRLLWNQIDKDGGLEHITLVQLRTFVMTVFQHVTFCRFRIFIPNIDSVHGNPHMMMCLYLHQLDVNSVEGPGEMYLFPPLK